MDKEEKTVTTLKNKIKEIKEILPNVNIPTMGIVNEESKIIIDNKEFINKKAVKEE